MSEFTDEAGRPIDLAKLAEIVEATSIWSVASVDVEPETKLTQWRVFKVLAKDGLPESVHFVGYTGWEGRVCSAVQTYDPKTKRGVTRSGRVYELVGQSGYNSDAMYVWSRWYTRNGLGDDDVVDITKVYDND